LDVTSSRLSGRKISVNLYNILSSGSTSNQKAKRPKCPSQQQKVVTLLYNKLCDVFRNLSELLGIQLLTDTTVLQVSMHPG